MLVHGREGGEIRKRSRHMLSVSSDSPSAVVVPRDSPRTCFFKDGRKISVGDCALFKPAQDSPTSVGIIYSLTPKKESNLTLGVKWLYRPAKVKLLKGVALEALPNEVFYSFLLDEIPAASLLHPCKVSFLPKGAELPQGAASFVCRRVYDITNKCLWWLSDQDFIDERQEEVDKLLRKTQLEMHASLDKQQGPHSSNGLAATSTQKHSPDGVQNSSSYLYSKPKGKKRDRVDQSSEITKRERIARGEEGDSCQLRSERFLNLEIAKVAERGGLADSEAVAKLVHLMQPERSQRKIDLAGRSMLAGIIAATDKPDYLSQFIQLRGLVVLDEWLQEVHKGKIGNSGNVKDSDKSVENFILVLLCALVKLPVNLNALQMCNIGKSVNYLRSHKNSEIQQKARSLVDTWKKRVEAEMTLSDAKPGSTHPVPSPGRSRDGFHGIGGYKNPSMKSSSVKLAQGETKLKSGSAYQSNARPALAQVPTVNNCNDEQSRIFDYGGSSEAALIAAREEKNSVSSHLHTDSQCSSDHDKYVVPCGKDDSKRSTTGSKSVDKTIGNDSRQCRHGKVTNRSSVEKIDRSVHVSNVPEGNYQKLIVKIPSRVNGPAQTQSIVQASAEDPSSRNSRVSSPSLSETCDKSDAALRGKQNSHRSDEAGGLSAAEHQRTSDTRISPDVSKVACFPAMTEVKSRTVNDSAFGPFNALIESCIMLSEADVSMSVGDDIGIKLLASVAVGEISDFGIVSPAVSPHRPSNFDIVSPAGNDCNISSVVSNINDGESTQHLGILHEDLHQKEEDCFRDNGISVKHIIPCTSGSLADAKAGVFNEKEGGVKDECCNQLLVSSESVANGVEAKDKVNDVSCYEKFDNTAHRDITYPSVNNDEVKINVCVVPENLSPMEQTSRSVSLYSQSRFTDEVPVICSRTSRHLVAARATINVVKPPSVDLCDHANEDGKKKIVQESAPSQNHENQEDFGMRCADVSMDTGSKDENLDKREAFLQHSRHSSPQLCSSVVLTEDFHPSTKDANFQGRRKPDSGSFSAAGGSVGKTKHIFDLNEGLNADDGNFDEPVSGAIDPCNAVISPVSLSQVPIASASGGLLTSTTTKKPFVPTHDLLRSKTELGWKGPASTSAFRPAEPRKVPELLPGVSGSTPHDGEAPCSDGGACKPARPPLDFDLNVADESFDQESEFKLNSVSTLETTASLHSRVGLDLDLNKIEGSDMMQQSASESFRNEISIPPVKVLSSSIFSNGEASGKMDFDLNDGPAIEKLPVEQTSYSQLACNNNPLQSSFGPRFYNSNAGNLIAWNPPGTSYSVSVSPSGLPDRKTFSVGGTGGGPHRVMGGSTSGLSFYPDTYRGSVLASSPALPFQHASFQYPVFGFRPGFPPLTSALASGPSGYVDPITNGRISAIPPQLVGNAAAVSFQYPYGFPHSVPDVGNNGVFDNNQKWGNQGLDLNSGPGVVDMEGMDRSMPTVSRQVSAISSQPLVEEQAMMYSMGGGVLKRREPDGGSSMDKLNFKQPSWWR